MFNALKESRLFEDHTTQEVQRIAALCEERAFAAGATIFENGSPADYLYLVSEGSVELRFSVTYYLASQEITIERMFKGDAFGWSAVVPPHTFTLAAVAVRDSKLVRISSAALKRLCEEDDHFGHLFMKKMAEIVGHRLNTLQRMLIHFVQAGLKKQEPPD